MCLKSVYKLHKLLIDISEPHKLLIDISEFFAVLQVESFSFPSYVLLFTFKLKIQQ